MRTVTVITGGAGGIGKATAKILGKDHYVILGDVSRDRLDAAIAELPEAMIFSKEHQVRNLAGISMQ